MKKFYVEVGIAYSNEEDDACGEWVAMDFTVKANTVKSAKDIALGMGLERNGVIHTWILHIEEKNESFVSNVSDESVFE